MDESNSLAVSSNSVCILCPEAALSPTGNPRNLRRWHHIWDGISCSIPNARREINPEPKHFLMTSLSKNTVKAH
jgi:hypothetical protein